MAREHLPPRGGGSNQQVGRYQILSHIASGGMGAVYLAFDPVLNRNVALKVMSPDMAARPQMVQRFQREAKAAAKLKHENIVQIFDFGEAAGTYYLALEFVDGTDLEDYIEQRPGGRLDVDETIAIAIQAAKALDHAYSQDIVHRDIKPSNFLVTTRGGKLFIKLTDMGLAREADDSRITRDNTTLGTVEYISPEQARDSGSADTRSDLYSLGCSIFHMLVGHAPFPKGTLIEKVQHHLSTPPPDVRAHRSDVSDHLADVVFKLLEKDPNERYETPLHLLHDLMTPDDFAEYLRNTRELVRPVFRPPTHHKRTIAATVQLPLAELLPPSGAPLSAKVRVVAERADTLIHPSGSRPAAPVKLDRMLATISETVVAPIAVTKEAPPPAKIAAKGPPPPRSEKAPPAHRALPRDKPERPSQPIRAAKSKSEPAKPARGARPRSASSAAHERWRRREKQRLWKSPLWIGGIVGGLLFAAFGVWAVTLLFHRPRQPEIVFPDALALDNEPPIEPASKVIDEPKTKPVPVKPVDHPRAESAPSEPPLPAMNGKLGPETPEPKLLTKGLDKVDVAAIEREIVGPHGDFPKTPKDAAVLRISRGRPPQAGSFANFADAWREAGKIPHVVLEVHDRGPLAIPSLPPVAASSLTIRPAPGIRPLLVWDKKPGDRSMTWMPLERGSLILEDVDLLVRDDVMAEEAAACFGVGDGDAGARNVNLIQADSARGGVALFRVAGRGAGQQVRLERCFLRGPGIMGACIAAVQADLLFDRSLVVGQRQPIVAIVGQGTDIANVRAVRSTLASAKAIIHYRPSEGQAIAPRLGVFGLDALLTNPGPDNGGALLHIDESVGTSGLAAKIANSAFAGWPTLLRARQIRFTTLAEWRMQWGHRDGDAIVPEHWPPIPDDDFDRVAPLNCSPLDSAVAFASLKQDALAGCPVGHLPPEPSAWRLLPAASLPAAVLDLPEAIEPAIDAANDGLFHGAVIDLSRGIDLGEYLSSQVLAPRVVVHLVGRGTFRSSPLRWRDTHLVVYAPPIDGPTLEFQAPQGTAAEALLDFEKGGLELINVRIRLDWKKLADMPKSVIRVRDGSLSLARCVVQTPLAKVPAAFDALVVVESSSAAAPARFAARDCVFLTGAAFAALEGPAAQMRCHQSLILAMDDAVEFKPGLIDAPPSASVRFDYNTLVLDKAFLHVHPARSTGSLSPMPVHATANYFSSPTPGGNALLLRSEGEALASGQFVWHGQGNAFDLGAFPHAVAWGRDVLAVPFPRAWNDLWGHSAEREPLLLPAKQPRPKALNLDQPNWERFILPNHLRLDLPGAPLQQLIPLIGPRKK